MEKKQTVGITSQEAAKRKAAAFKVYKNPVVLKMADIFRKSAYQKDFRPAQVAKIIKEFDYRLFEPIIVSRHPDGRYFVVEGQHRYVAAEDMGWNEIMCVVVDSTGLVEDANTFQAFNKAGVKIYPNTVEKFRAKVVSLDPDAVLLNSVLEQYGFTVSNSRGAYKVKWVNDLYRIQNVYTVECLKATLHVIKTAYSGSADALDRGIFNGLAAFIGSKMHHPNFHVDEFAKKLQTEVFSKPPHALNTSFLTAKKNPMNPKSLDDIGIETFTQMYNHRRRKSNLI